MLGPVRQFSRPRLMTRLMAERSVPRFLVAPAGFGKTMLALEYAESIFDFRGVYWVRCQSPCFLRDLDKGVLATTLLGSAPEGRLAVFDDVPHLDDGRARAFSDDLDMLLAAGWEVLIAVTPAADALANLQPHRVLLGSSDFLVDDTELSATGCDSLLGIAKADRLASFVWGGEEDVARFLDGLKAEAMPAEVRLAVFAMLLLQEGALDDVLSFAHGLKKDMRAFVEEHYPYAGLDLVNERFHARDLPVSSMKQAFGDSFAAMAACFSSSQSRDVLACRLADALVARGGLRRASEFMREFCSRKRRPQWMERAQERYLHAGQVLPMQSLFESMGANPGALSPFLLLGAAYRLALLGESGGAGTYAVRAMNAAESDRDALCEAALLCEECAPSSQRKRSQAVLLQAQEWPDLDETLRTIASSRLALEEGLAQALDCLQGREEALAACSVGKRYVTHLLALANEREPGGPGAWPACDVKRLIDMALGVLSFCRKQRSAPNLSDALLKDALPAKGEKTPESVEWDAECDMLVLMLEKQRRLYAEKGGSRSLSAPSRSRSSASQDEGREMVPEMYVRLFGGMEVRVGSRVLDPRSFAKQRSKILLAVLALRKGKEVPRHELLEIIWPLASTRSATNNFYSLWSSLKKALSNDTGECPYLVRHQASCMLDSRYVKTDVEEFEALCRKLLFDAPNLAEWMEIFGRLQDQYSAALLPSEVENEYIVAARERYRLRLADAYVSAAGRLCDAGEPQAALWFAKAAFEQSSGREDAYYVLMRAQILAGQRTLAVETFHAYKDYLRDELGMDPSERMMKLYMSVIASTDGGL